VTVGILDIDTALISKTRMNIDVLLSKNLAHLLLSNPLECQCEVIHLTTSMDNSGVFEKQTKLVFSTLEKTADIDIEFLVGRRNCAPFKMLMGDNESEQVDVEVLGSLDICHVEYEMVKRRCDES